MKPSLEDRFDRMVDDGIRSTRPEAWVAAIIFGIAIVAWLVSL